MEGLHFKCFNHTYSSVHLQHSSIEIPMAYGGKREYRFASWNLIRVEKLSPVELL